MTLLDENATKIRSGFFDYRKTPIALTQGAAESSPPYMRDASDKEPEEEQDAEPEEKADDDANVRRRLHGVLDLMMDVLAKDAEKNKKPAKVTIAPMDDKVIAADARRSTMTDAPRKICYCCGNLGGVKGYNEAHRFSVQ